MADKQIRLIGFNITKIHAERNQGFDGKLGVKSNVNIKNIEKFKPELAKQDSLKIDFVFEIDYSELGKVSIEGTMFITADSKQMKEILNSWKDKNLNSELHLGIINIILQKASLRAFQLEEELGLPIHIRLPRIRPNPQEQQEKN